MHPFIYANDTLKTPDGKLIGIFDNFKIKDRNGVLMGHISVPWIVDPVHGRVARYDRGGLRDLDNQQIVSTSEISASIEGPKNIVVAALWFYFVR